MLVSRGWQDGLLWALASLSWVSGGLVWDGHASWVRVWLVTTAVLFLGSVLALAQESRLPARIGLLTTLAMIVLAIVLPSG